METKRLSEQMLLNIKNEYEGFLARGGPPPQPRPSSQASWLFSVVRQGDGKYDEAIAAIMWHCGLSAEEAVNLIADRGKP